MPTARGHKSRPSQLCPWNHLHPLVASFPKAPRYLLLPNVSVGIDSTSISLLSYLLRDSESTQKITCTYSRTKELRVTSNEIQNAILHRSFLQRKGTSDLMRPELFWKTHFWNMISPLRVKGLYDIPDSERRGILSNTSPHIEPGVGRVCARGVSNRINVCQLELFLILSVSTTYIFYIGGKRETRHSTCEDITALCVGGYPA